MVVKVATEREFDMLFAKCTSETVGALSVSGGPFFKPTATNRGVGHRYACRQSILREYAEAGGLISYGPARQTIIGMPEFMSAGFSRVKSPPTCRSAGDQIRAGH